MLVLSSAGVGGFLGRNFKKILSWGAAFAMLAVSGVAVFNAINILAAPADSWKIESDGSGLLNVLTATSQESGEVKTVYCLDPYTDFTTSYPDYVYVEASDLRDVEALLKRSYPVLTAKQMGIVYLNDASLTDLEAYEATQIAIWKTVTNGEYEVNDVLVGRQFELVNVLLESDIVMNEGPWLTVNTSSAVRQSSNATRESYGPITINVNTGSTRLDTAIKNENLTLTPAAGERSWTISTSSAVTGSATSTIKAGTSYYINYLKTQAGAVEFSLSNELTDSKSLDSVDEIISIYGADVNQKLGVVLDSPKYVSSGIIDLVSGSTSMTLRKTWRCTSSSECLTNFGDTIYFDIYENTGNGYTLLGTFDTKYTSMMSPNTAQSVANDYALKTYTEYVVIERTLVPVTPNTGDMVSSMTSSYGTAGKYKVTGGVLETAGASESYYAGVKFTTGMNGSTEIVSAENRTASMNITLSKSASVSYIYDYYSELVPDTTKYYIYSSTDGGATWSSVTDPVTMYDYDSETGSSYSFDMTPGTKYRVIEDTLLFDVYRQYDECYQRNLDSFAYVTGTNYSNLNNLKVLRFSNYTTPTSVSSTISFPGQNSYAGYTGFEWEAGWTEGATSISIANTFRYYSDNYICEPEEPDPEPEYWQRGLSIQKYTSGNNQAGWASDFEFDWTVSGEYEDGGEELEVPINTSAKNVFYVDGDSMYGDFPYVTYTVTEKPQTFCAGKSEVTGTVSETIDGVTKTTTTTASYSTAFSIASGNYSNVTYEYAAADCSTGAVIGTWSTAKPAGVYAARVRVTTSGYTYNGNVTVRATNSVSSQSTVSYSSASQENVALVLKYGWDGYNQVANYLDGTKFEIYDDADNFVADWVLSASDRGKYGAVAGTSDYYVTPVLPVGEYYLKETEAVPGYYADTESKYFFTIAPVNGVTALSITQVRKNGVAGANTNFGKAILNEPTYELAAFKFKRKVLESAIEDSHIELFRFTATVEEPAYGNENLRGYEKVAEFDSLVDGIVIEELVYGWYKLVEVTPPEGYVGPEPEVAVGFSTYIGPTEDTSNNYSGARVYIANDWVGLDEEPPVDPGTDPEDPENPEVPQAPNTGSGRVGINGGMVAASFIGIGCAMVLGIAMFVGKKLTEEIEDSGSIKLQR
ncbi:MAG: SpaA isopeptide-forming pilin-related protein [Candidatus Saccharimonadales bacterium]